jgi:osmotically-inducible protein OsmY
MNADYQYLVGKIQSALACHPRTNKLDVKVMIVGGKIHLMGQTSTEERRRAIAEVVAEAVPDMDVRNELTVIEIGSPAPSEDLCD